MISRAKDKSPSALGPHSPAHDLDATTRGSHGHGCSRDALDLQIAHHAQTGAPDLANHISCRNLYIVEHQLSSVGGPTA
jgi:hypothetical protein